MTAKIIIYTKTTCPFCINAKNLLKMLKQTYTEINIENNDAVLQEMLSKSNGQKTVPQIFINDEHIGGFSDMLALHQKGLLKPKFDI